MAMHEHDLCLDRFGIHAWVEEVLDLIEGTDAPLEVIEADAERSFYAAGLFQLLGVGRVMTAPAADPLAVLLGAEQPSLMGASYPGESAEDIAARFVTPLVYA